VHQLKNRETKHVLAVAGARVMDVLCGIGKVLRQPSQLLLVGVVLLEPTTTPGEIAMPNHTRVGVQAVSMITATTGYPMAGTHLPLQENAGTDEQKLRRATLVLIEGRFG